MAPPFVPQFVLISNHGPMPEMVWEPCSWENVLGQYDDALRAFYKGDDPLGELKIFQEVPSKLLGYDKIEVN